MISSASFSITLFGLPSLRGWRFSSSAVAFIDQFTFFFSIFCHGIGIETSLETACFLNNVNEVFLLSLTRSYNRQRWRRRRCGKLGLNRRQEKGCCSLPRSRSRLTERGGKLLRNLCLRLMNRMWVDVNINILHYFPSLHWNLSLSETFFLRFMTRASIPSFALSTPEEMNRNKTKTRRKRKKEKVHRLNDFVVVRKCN